jgi:hypothetical protein
MHVGDTRFAGLDADADPMAPQVRGPGFLRHGILNALSPANRDDTEKNSKQAKRRPGHECGVNKSLAVKIKETFPKWYLSREVRTAR